MYIRTIKGIGVATLILKVLMAEAKRQKYLIIYSDASITARPFFESQGFKAVHENVKMVRGWRSGILEWNMVWNQSKAKGSCPIFTRCEIEPCFVKKTQEFVALKYEKSS